MIFRHIEEGSTNTPERTPKSSRKVFGSIEKSLDKMRNMLTPRRRLNSDEQISVVENKVKKSAYKRMQKIYQICTSSSFAIKDFFVFFNNSRFTFGAFLWIVRKVHLFITCVGYFLNFKHEKFIN